MTEFYYIPQWKDTFENAQSKRVIRRMTWVPVPTKHDGAGYRRVVRDERACEVLGAWMLIVEVAAKCPVRGALTGDRGPLTADDLELMTGVPQAAFEHAFEILVDDKIGWLAVGTSEHDDGPGLLDVCRSMIGLPTVADDDAPRKDGGTPRPADDAPRKGEGAPAALHDGALQDRSGPVLSVEQNRSGKSRAGPELSSQDSAGPDRGCNGNGVDQVFRLTFFTRLADAFGWNSDEAINQRRSLLAVARKFEREPTTRRDELAEGLIALAKEKVAAGLDRPVAAWQKEANRWFEPARAPPEHRKHAVG